MKVFSWPAFLFTLLYAGMITCLLVSLTGDGEEITYGWLFLGFPGIYIVHTWNGWGAIVFNAALVYATFAYLIPGFLRAYRKYSRPPDSPVWPRAGDKSVLIYCSRTRFMTGAPQRL